MKKLHKNFHSMRQTVETMVCNCGGTCPCSSCSDYCEPGITGVTYASGTAYTHTMSNFSWNSEVLAIAATYGV